MFPRFVHLVTDIWLFHIPGTITELGLVREKDLGPDKAGRPHLREVRVSEAQDALTGPQAGRWHAGLRTSARLSLPALLFLG